MTRRQIAAAIRALPSEERLSLLGELWDSLDADAPIPDWHKAELDRRLADPGAETVSWADVRASVLGPRR